MRLRAAIALAIISNQCSVFVKLESCSLQQNLQQYITNYNTTSTRVGLMTNYMSNWKLISAIPNYWNANRQIDKRTDRHTQIRGQTVDCMTSWVMETDTLGGSFEVLPPSVTATTTAIGWRSRTVTVRAWRPDWRTEGSEWKHVFLVLNESG